MSSMRPQYQTTSTEQTLDWGTTSWYGEHLLGQWK